MKRRKEKNEGQDALFEIEQTAVDDPGDEAAPGQGPAAEDIRKAASDEPEEAILDPLTREQREARRSARRQRRKVASYWLGVAAALSAVLLVILLSPWGPFKDTIYGKGAGPPRRTFQTRGGPPGTRQTAPPGSSAPSLASATVPEGKAANRAGAPAHNAKKSDPTLPAIAIVVDDVGNGKEHISEWLAIDAPLNFAVMPHLQLSRELAETLYGNGYAVMMHVPTTNAGNSYSGPGQLAVGMDRGTVFGTLDADLATIPHVEGVNNHQGGMGCDNWNIMYYECEWAKSRGLFVVDSNSSCNSQVTPACLALGMGKKKNQVFIDHENDPDYIRRAMQELAGRARKNGTSIGICHWHRPNTAKVVGEMINTLRSQGIHFAYVREITD